MPGGDEREVEPSLESCQKEVTTSERGGAMWRNKPVGGAPYQLYLYTKHPIVKEHPSMHTKNWKQTLKRTAPPIWAGNLLKAGMKKLNHAMNSPQLSLPWESG